MYFCEVLWLKNSFLCASVANAYSGIMSSLYLLSAICYLLSPISGYVRDEETGLPLASVSVFLEGTGYGTFTDENGHYSLRNIPDGKYILVVKLIGFETKRREIEVHLDRVERADFYLSPDPIEMEGVLVQAHPSDLIIITREEMKKAVHDNIGGVIDGLPGISIRTTGTRQLVSIRGCDPNQVKIMLDGVRINDAGSGTVDLSLISKEIVERIEIVKGGSILHGESAIGGVINIVTRCLLNRKIEKERIDLGINIGSFRKQNYKIAFPPFFSLQLKKRDDFRYNDGDSKSEKRENSLVSSINIFSKIPTHIGKRKINFIFHYVARKKGIPGAIEMPTPGARSREQRGLFQGEIIFPHIRAETYVTVRGWHYLDSLSWAKLDTYHRNITYGQILTGEWNWRRNYISYGSSYRKSLLLLDDRIRPKNSLNRERDEGSLWLRNETRFGSSYTRGTITSSISYNMVDDRAPLINPSIGIAISRGERSVLGFSANWGRGYRLPSLFELFWVPGVFAMGNPDLLPERSKNIEYGVNISLPFYGTLRGETTFFHTDIDDIIIWRRRLFDRYSPDNVSRALLYGRETTISWNRSQIELEINHTYLSARNYGEEYYGKWLILRPRHRVTVKIGNRLSVLGDRFSIYSNLEWRWVDKRYIREANTKWLPPYTVIDANIGIETSLFGKEFEIRLESRNLGDESYQILERFPMPGRSWAVGLDFRG